MTLIVTQATQQARRADIGAGIDELLKRQEVREAATAAAERWTREGLRHGWITEDNYGFPQIPCPDRPYDADYDLRDQKLVTLAAAHFCACPNGEPILFAVDCLFECGEGRAWDALRLGAEYILARGCMILYQYLDEFSREFPTEGTGEELALLDTHPGDATAGQYLFQQDRNSYHITFDGCYRVTVKHNLGMQYIEHIVRNPHTPVLVWDLEDRCKLPAHRATPDEDFGTFGSNDPEDEGPRCDYPDLRSQTHEMHSGTVMDGRAKREAETRLDNLRSQRDAATDPAKIAEFDEEIEQLNAILSAAVNVHGRLRKLDDKSDKCRQRVKVAITRALDQMRDNDQSREKRVWRHFYDSISTGNEVRYAPESLIPWQF